MKSARSTRAQLSPSFVDQILRIYLRHRPELAEGITNTEAKPERLLMTAGIERNAIMVR